MACTLNGRFLCGTLNSFSFMKWKAGNYWILFFATGCSCQLSIWRTQYENFVIKFRRIFSEMLLCAFGSLVFPSNFFHNSLTNWSNLILKRFGLSTEYFMFWASLVVTFIVFNYSCPFISYVYSVCFSHFLPLSCSCTSLILVFC